MPLFDDDVYEGSEHFVVAFGGGELDRQVAHVYPDDDESRSSVDPLTVPEGDGPGTVTVRLRLSNCGWRAGASAAGLPRGLKIGGVTPT